MHPRGAQLALVRDPFTLSFHTFLWDVVLSHTRVQPLTQWHMHGTLFRSAVAFPPLYPPDVCSFAHWSLTLHSFTVPS